jgi:hypothetical protein
MAARTGFCYGSGRPWEADSKGETIMRIAMAVVAGIVVAFLCVFAVEFIGHALYPPPAGLDMKNPADQARLMEAMPAAAKAMVLLGWFVGSLAGAWVANRIAGRSLAGWIVALLVVAAGVATMVMIPHPAWMWAGGIALPLAGAWVAERLAGRRPAGAA